MWCKHEVLATAVSWKKELIKLIVLNKLICGANWSFLYIFSTFIKKWPLFWWTMMCLLLLFRIGPCKLGYSNLKVTTNSILVNFIFPICMVQQLMICLPISLILNVLSSAKIEVNQSNSQSCLCWRRYKYFIILKIFTYKSRPLHFLYCETLTPVHGFSFCTHLISGASFCRVEQFSFLSTCLQ